MSALMSSIRIATILPVPFLHMEDGAMYHMCLAHLMHVPEYGQFFANQARNGRFVLMDNGVVETGEPLSFPELLLIARQHGVTQMTLPDRINDRRRTLDLIADALAYHRGDCYRSPSMMAIPQGRTLDEWISCAQEIIEMVDTSVRALGVTKFLADKVSQRSEAISAVPGLLSSGLDIHLLGCMADDPSEIYRTVQSLPPGAIRGCDSGMAAIWTQEGLAVGEDTRPRVEMNFMTDGAIPPGYSRRLLRENIARWKASVDFGRARTP